MTNNKTCLRINNSYKSSVEDTTLAEIPTTKRDFQCFFMKREVDFHYNTCTYIQ